MTEVKKSMKELVEEQYNKLKEQAAGGNLGNVSMEERRKKYFTTILPDGVTTMERRIRILPTEDGSSPFVQQKFHEMQVGSRWLKIWDPAQEGKKSPLNEVFELLMSTGKEEDKNLAKTYRPKDFFIVKLIDRDAEQDGPKFWRFKRSFRNDGVFDKIFPVIKNSRVDIDDPEKGKDLIITLTLTKANNGKSYTKVTSVIADDSTPLSEDETKKQEWLNDKLTWADVYSKKPTEYLEIIAQGDTPMWDNDNKKWEIGVYDENQKKWILAVNTTEGENKIGGKTEETDQENKQTTETKTETSENTEYNDPQNYDEPDDDLPF